MLEKICFSVSKMAFNSASFNYCYQPKEPKELKKILEKDER